MKRRIRQPEDHGSLPVLRWFLGIGMALMLALLVLSFAVPSVLTSRAGAWIADDIAKEFEPSRVTQFVMQIEVQGERIESRLDSLKSSLTRLNDSLDALRTQRMEDGREIKKIIAQPQALIDPTVAFILERGTVSESTVEVALWREILTAERFDEIFFLERISSQSELLVPWQVEMDAAVAERKVAIVSGFTVLGFSGLIALFLCFYYTYASKPRDWSPMLGLSVILGLVGLAAIVGLAAGAPFLVGAVTSKVGGVVAWAGGGSLFLFFGSATAPPDPARLAVQPSQSGEYAAAIAEGAAELGLEGVVALGNVADAGSSIAEVGAEAVAAGAEMTAGLIEGVFSALGDILSGIFS